ncbi:GntR family transcriptional regulator [Nioella sp.]|uniref:GntR family transcriptional regulator n=1 Tax=Nioella sp. TaxID=1912091 RepID=UPI003514F1B9
MIDASALPVAPLDLSRPAAEQIASALKTAILSMTLEPGQMISENEVGQLFGASRTPVREAFAQLRDDGLLLTWPSRGTYVAKLSERQIRGAQFLREALEVAVVERLCAEGLPDDARTELDQNLTRQRKAVADDDKTTFQALDDQFHAILARATGYDRVGGLLLREKATLDRLRVLSLNDAAHMRKLLAEHEGILEAVIAGYSGQALDRMRRHLRNVLRTLSGLIDENRDFFGAEDKG